MADGYFGVASSTFLGRRRHDRSVWSTLFAASLKEGCSALASRLSADRTDTTIVVGFLNMHNYVACDDAALAAFADFDFMFGDGIGLQVAKLFVPAPSFHRVSGSDLVPALLSDRQCPALRVFLLGGERRFIARTADRFPELFPKHELVGYHHGFLAPLEEDRVVGMINASRADLLLIGMGTPHQELWLAQHRDRVKPRMAICVGGLFHYWHGSLLRAPRVLRHVGLEWLWILLQQPSKWRRYAFGPWKLLRALIRTRGDLRTWR